MILLSSSIRKVIRCFISVWFKSFRLVNMRFLQEQNTYWCNVFTVKPELQCLFFDLGLDIRCYKWVIYLPCVMPLKFMSSYLSKSLLFTIIWHILMMKNNKTSVFLSEFLDLKWVKEIPTHLIIIFGPVY